MIILLAIIFVSLGALGLAWCDHHRAWKDAHKWLIGLCIPLMLVNNMLFYKPSPNTQPLIGGVIDVSDVSFNYILLISIAETVAITGLIASIITLDKWLWYHKKININPFKKERQ